MFHTKLVVSQFAYKDLRRRRNTATTAMPQRKPTLAEVIMSVSDILLYVTGWSVNRSQRGLQKLFPQ